jgi:bifunctional UDP-N-acetylglucosamine pyrophosphorylase/glucosamine-1-phosphate N-acetyltransferase
MILRAISACKDAGISEIRLVLGHGRELVAQTVAHTDSKIFVQASQQGTADAVKSADFESLEGTVVILNGDHPLLTGADIREFLMEFKETKASVAVVSTELEEPGSFGRIVRHKGELRAIVEAKDASSEALKIKEVNTGLYIAKAEALVEYLPLIQSQNIQNEYYLTDLISLSHEHGEKVIAIKGRTTVAFGVNSQDELSRATQKIFKAKVQSLLENGVIIIDPDHTYVEEAVEVGASTVIYPGVYLKGKTKIASFCVLEPNCMIIDSELAEHVEVKASSYIEGSKIGKQCVIGPFARLRPETELADEVKIGNFVETKKVKLAKGVKASHLTYLGDAEVGEGTNIGCGTITCNYAADKKKYKTVIGKNVFVGSDTQFVAPITIGDGAVIGSGSTITKDVPANALAVARGKQFIKENYKKEK